MAFPEEKKKGLELSAVVRAVVLLSLISAVFFYVSFYRLLPVYDEG